MGRNIAHILLGLALLIPVSLLSQHTHPLLGSLDSLIAADALETARKIIEQKISESKKDPTLNRGELVYPLARIEFLNNHETGFPQAEALLAALEGGTPPDSVRYEAFLGLGLARLDQGSAQQASEYLTHANRLAHSMQDIPRMVESEFYLGETGLKLGDIDQLRERTERALRLMAAHPGTRFPLAPRILNYKASLMHFMGKPDSADYYFEIAVQRLDQVSGNPESLYYLPGTIYGNWTMAKQTAGEYDAAMKLTLKSISSFNTFLQKTHNHPLTEKVHGNLSIAYRNLGSLYNDLGDKEKAIQVASMGYSHAKKVFRPNTVQYFSAVLMMAEAHLYAENLHNAGKYLEEAKTSLIAIPGNNWSYAANLYFALGDLNKKEGNLPEAIAHYQKSLQAYTQSSPDEFSQNIIYARSNLAQVYAEDGQYKEAEELIDQTYARVVAAYGKDSYLAKRMQVGLVRIAYRKGDFETAAELCVQLLKAYDKGTDLENRPYLWGEQAEILTYLAKSKLALLPGTPEHLREIAKHIDGATALVEKQKSLVTSQEGVGNLIAQNREVFNVAKKIYGELYRQTKEEALLEKVIALHESSLYNRLRARLNLTTDSFAPADIREQEHALRSEINAFFDPQHAETQFSVAKWDSLGRAWQDHLALLEKQHPEYYRMRYATLLEPLKDLAAHIPHNTTLVRYFSDGVDLYAYVHGGGRGQLVPLEPVPEGCMATLSDYSIPGEELFECLHRLYQVLWAPLASLVRTEKVIIFPDGPLFNLSFELLTPERIRSSQALATGSLLAKHTLSYNYSLFMLGKQRQVIGFREDFIAFAPEFDEEMKRDYRIAISDSLLLDKTYLTLLPQPFSSDLVKKFSAKFDGRSFLNERASKQLFTRNAREHKIIHIGTHAESNNVSPELSRLVFAKNVADSAQINDNYLHTYEIYDQNLNANLAILTACETGKPGYQPGEGMISLAHAFNYAGSESILTSLWQIDEKSSNEILESFYGYLYEGLHKDEALRQAKLDYLATHEGRTLHPQYWAGLVLMGDASPVPLSRPALWPVWVLGGLFLAGMGYYLIKRKAPR